MKIIVGTLDEKLYTLEYNQTLRIVDETPAKCCSFLALDGKSLYTTSEVPDQKGGIRHFKRDGSWTEEWFTQGSSEGTAHCCIAKDGDEKIILAANYVGHTIDVFSASGKLTQSIEFSGSGPFPGRQESSHCHQIIQNPHSGEIYVCDLGGDKVHIYTLDHGKLSERSIIRFKPGQGPRHITFNASHPDLIYCICELSNEIVILKDGKILQTTSVLPDQSLLHGQIEEFGQPASAGEIVISRDGHLYASTRFLPRSEGDGIQINDLDDEGLIASSTFYSTALRAPWHMTLSPDERILGVVYQFSNQVVLYDRATMSEVSRLEIIKPACILFL